ncbi:MAG: class I SAM-dependent methyltransferase [Deltaproteobacteria bacterium]|nr:class I SAM-dependent methyltransferase [Deltaproteobacteria bacterium]MBW1942130.1 class I SAM-dependent methyltransferase [Deltaproteobacteria bacterium]MBW2206282.1 class I SAM-dependent methyltransferase [Deltaproteobacteria bacterium]
MRKWLTIILSVACCLLVSGALITPDFSQGMVDEKAIDNRVKKFLKNYRGKWADWNVPEADGKALYNLIIQNKYKKALEIGTSTGRSAIWMAWALSKTGGKLITIEIDEERYRKALVNFEEAGLSPYIDARLADAHELVEELEGPFDFIFTDADKGWSKNYFLALEPKLEVGGCFTAHNVSQRHWGGIGEFLDYVESLPNFETHIDRSSSEGLSVSYKRSE